MNRQALWIAILLLICSLGLAAVEAAVESRQQRGGRGQAEARALAEEYTGVTTDGDVVSGLYAIEATGVSTALVKNATERFLESLTEQQRDATMFPIDDDEWRKWQNIHRYNRQGVSRREMNARQEHGRSKASACVTCDAGCLLNMDGKLRQQPGPRMVHLAEVLAAR